ncbi:MAG TPA: hypothetical protein DCM28_04640 [Phycisphaerales bacterium]|nr:hypothetical protein [Phycisphaerales bacterium]|tara:strand:- start:902 stop:2569 length:1668 start_codon:yes stop_codon:yes gene_type:complete
MYPRAYCVLVLLSVFLSPCLADTPDIAQPGWKGHPPSPEQLLASTLSFHLRGSWGGNTCIALATPQNDGSYKVRIETKGPMDGIQGPADFSENQTWHSIITYRLAAASIQKLQRQLATLDLHNMPECEMLNVTDVGMRMVCFDLPDGRRWVVGGTDDMEHAHPNRAALFKSLDTCFVIRMNVAKPPPAHLLDFKHQLSIDNQPDAISLTLLHPPALTLKTLPHTPGMLVLQSMYANRTSMTAEMVEALCHGSSRLIAVEAVSQRLGNPQKLTPSEAIRLLARVHRWLDADVAFHHRYMGEPANNALEWLAQQRNPQGLELCLDALHSQAQINKRNLHRQAAVGLLRNYYPTHRKLIEQEWIKALNHEDVYVKKLAAQCLVQMQHRPAGPLIAKQAHSSTLDRWTQLELHACALAMGVRSSAKPLVRLLETAPDPDCKQYYVGQASRVLGIGLTEADLASHMVNLPVEDDTAMFNLAMQRLKQLKLKPFPKSIVGDSLDGIAFRWYAKPEARQALSDIKEKLQKPMLRSAYNASEMSLNMNLRTIDEYVQGKFGSW